MEFKVKKFESIRGPAEVSVRKDTVVVRMESDGEFHTEGQLFEFAKKDCPEVLISDTLWVSMNKRGTVLYSLSPIEGEFVARFLMWKGKPNEVPEPSYREGGRKIRLEDGREWVTTPSQSMDPISVVAEGKYKGLTVLAFVPYIFAPSDQVVELANGVAAPIATVEGTKGQIEKVKDFFRATGILNERVPYERNMLPPLARLILEKNQPYQIKVANGLVNSFGMLPDGYRLASERPARKEAAKKTAAKSR